MNELLSEYIAERRRLGRSPATINNYMQQAKYIARTWLGVVDIKDLTGRVIDQFYGDMHDAGKGNTYVRRVHAVLSAALNWAVAKRDYLEINPCKKSTPPSEPRHKVKAPDTDVVQRIIDASPRRWSLMWRTAAITGMRRGELCGLRWDDINAFTNTITVRRSATRGGQVGETKTHRDRPIPVSPDLIERLTVLGPAPGRYVFGENVNSGPCSPDSATKAFATITRRLKIEGVTLHTLRHFAATQMIAGGVDVKTTSERLGHADVGITLRTYTDVVPAKAREAGQLLEDLLR